MCATQASCKYYTRRCRPERVARSRASTCAASQEKLRGNPLQTSVGTQGNLRRNVKTKFRKEKCGTLQETHRNPRETRRKPAGNPQETCRKPAGNPQETRRKPAGNPQETRRKPAGNLQESAGNLLETNRKRRNITGDLQETRRKPSQNPIGALNIPRTKFRRPSGDPPSTAMIHPLGNYKRFEEGGWGQACERCARCKQVESIIQDGAAQRVARCRVSTFAEDLGGDAQPGKPAARQTCDRKGKTAWEPATNERGNARKPTANCENQLWEGKVQNLQETHRDTRRKPAGNPQETRRKLAGNLQET